MSRPDPVMVERGKMWSQVDLATQVARQRGALHEIKTDACCLEQAGFTFLVRVAREPVGKPRASRPAGSRGNPFLPPDSDLVVGGVGEKHLCVLNKYPVVPGHALIVTREFVEQTSPLNHADFLAVASCLREGDGLIFYNSGPIAGASQPHRHLQAIRVPPRLQGGPPLLSRIDTASRNVHETSRDSPRQLPYRHRIDAIVSRDDTDLQAAASEMADRYETMRRAENAAPAYNLLVTRRWILFVPRTRECFRGISLNALAFVGSFFARDRQEFELLRDAGPLAALASVTSNDG